MTKALTTDEFIARARNVHGNKYDYSKVKYVNSATKVVIICPIHGEFEQSPLSHLKGRGCPRVSDSKMEQLLAMKRDLEREIKEFTGKDKMVNIF